MYIIDIEYVCVYVCILLILSMCVYVCVYDVDLLVLSMDGEKLCLEITAELLNMMSSFILPLKYSTK